jgi:hypothetical protein
MTAFIVGGLVVVVIIAIAWVRVRSGRSDRRSMETYGHGLAVLGDVAKRSGPSASVRVLPRAEVGRSHVRTDVPFDFDSAAPQRSSTHPRATVRPGNDTSPGGDTRPGAGRVPHRSFVVTGRTATETAAPERQPASGQPASGQPASGQPATGQPATGQPATGQPATGQPATGQPATGPRAARAPVASATERDLTFEGPGEAWPGAGRPSSREPGDRSSAGESRPPATPVTADRLRPSVSPDELRRQGAMRKIVVGSVAAVAVVLILAAAVLLTLHGSPHKAASPPASHTTTSANATTSTTAVTTTTTPVLKAVSTSGDSATYKAPSGRYTLRFTTTSGACWIGVQPSVGSGTYLYSSTLQAGGAASYKGSGVLAVQLGAPEYVSVSLNGVPVQVPTGATYYNLVFSPS